MKKKIILKLVTILSLVLILYLQFGRDFRVYDSQNFISGNNYREEISVIANQLIIINKKTFAEKVIKRCTENTQQGILFSYDINGYPDTFTVNVYTNKYQRKRNSISFRIIAHKFTNEKISNFAKYRLKIEEN